MSTAQPGSDRRGGEPVLSVLFVLDPHEERGEPLLLYPALTAALLPQIQRLMDEGHDTQVLLGASVAEQVRRDELLRYLGHHSVLTVPEPVASQPRSVWDESPAPSALLEDMQKCVRRSLRPEFNPDMIIVWGSSCPYLAAEFPRATIIHQSAGFLSQPPHPELIAFEAGAAPRDIAPRDAESEVHAEDAAVQLNRLRLRDRALFEDAWPLPGLLNRWREGCDALVLVHLEAGADSTIADARLPSQRPLDWLEDLLEKAPAGLGLIVTEDVPEPEAPRTLTDDAVVRLRERHPGLLYDRRLQDVPCAAPLLASRVDGVATLSPALGWQAAYWQKPSYPGDARPGSLIEPPASLEDFFAATLAGQVVDHDALIATHLHRTHIPIRWIADQPGFLASWLGKIHANSDRRDLGVAVMSPPVEMEPYFDGLIELRREDDLAERFRESGFRFRRPKRSFWTEMAEALDSADVVSFDIFDTLLERPLARPTELFEWMEAEVHRRLARDDFDFGAERRVAEEEAIRRARSRGEGDTTLEEIYATLGERLGLGVEAREELARYELDSERSVLRLRETGLRAFAMARALGRRVILLSDMYLPRSWIADTLTRLGLEGWEAIYVSSEIKRKKQDGGLFAHVQDQLGLPAERFLHVGDNRIGDLEQPRSRGWSALLMRRSQPELARTDFDALLPASSDPKRGRAATVLRATVSQAFFWNPDRAPETREGLFDGDAWELGFAALGPLLIGFARWIYRCARERGYSRLYFLARDGEVIKRAYDVLVADLEDAPESRFLFCSRRSVSVVSIQDRSGVEALLQVDFDPVEIEVLLRDRFGIAPDRIPLNTLRDAGLAPGEVVRMHDRPRIARLLELLMPLPLEASRAEREAYLHYLRAEGFFEAESAAVVDIGYAGTMQEALSKMLSPGQELGGLYLLTFDSARDRTEKRGLRMHGYLGELVDRRDLDHSVARHVPIYETLFSSQSTSLVKMELREGEARPVFLDPSPTEERRRQLVGDVQAGALECIRRVRETTDLMGDCWDLDPGATTRVLADFIQSPCPAGARLFEGVPFEDVYGARTTRWIVPPPELLEEGEAIWGAGHRALVAERHLGAGHERWRRYRAILASRMVVPLVNRMANLVLPERKLWKFRHEPAAFFRDARDPRLRTLGRFYCEGLYFDAGPLGS